MPARYAALAEPVIRFPAQAGEGQGPWADLLRTRFARATRKLGLNRERIQLRTDLFRPPEGDQLRLF